MLTSKTSDAPATTVWAAINPAMTRSSGLTAMASKPASDERRKLTGAASSAGSSAAAGASAAGTVRPAMSAAETRNVAALTR